MTQSNPHFLTKVKTEQLTQTSYSRDALETKIIHIGFGAFHRAHQAVYTDLANQVADSTWGIYGINLFRKGSLTELFLAQNNLSVLIEKSAHQYTKRLIRCFTGAMNINDKGVQAALIKLTEPQVAIVSLTITEKGYCLTHDGKLNQSNELIAHDLASPQTPKSAIGIICEALRRRRQLNLPAFTIMSCDNIPENGLKTKMATLEYASIVDDSLAEWINNNATFPSTMVDRIVPAMSNDSFNELENETGVRDQFGLISESFKQWVIEDQFCAGRPNWQLSGAMLVDEVLPYEEMKLRMLNGAHSFLAYIGSLRGYTYIYECMEDPCLKEITLHLMVAEQAKSLSDQLNVDLVQYANTLIDRFSNKNIKHQTNQIAIDGSQKLRPRVIDPILALLSKFQYSDTNPPPILLLLLAGWMHFIQGKHMDNFQLIDPENQELETLLEAPGHIPQSLLRFKPVFSNEFLIHKNLQSQVVQFYNAIEEQGIKAVLDELQQSLRTTL